MYDHHATYSNTPRSHVLLHRTHSQRLITFIDQLIIISYCTYFVLLYGSNHWLREIARVRTEQNQ